MHYASILLLLLLLVDDKKIEIVGLTGSFHVGQIKVGLSSAIALRQCSKVRIKIIRGEYPLQVDGEPTRGCEGTVIEISHLNQAFMLQRSIDSGDDAAAISMYIFHLILLNFMYWFDLVEYDHSIIYIW